MDDFSVKPPTPLERLKGELEFAADQLLRSTPDFKRRKEKLVQELAKTANRAIKGKSSPKKPKEQEAAEARFKSDPIFNSNKPQKINRRGDTRRRNLTMMEDL